MSLVAKAARKQAAGIRCPKEKYISTESEDPTPSTAVAFKNVNILWQQREFFGELKTRVTLPPLPTIYVHLIMNKKCYSTCRQY